MAKDDALRKGASSRLPVQVEEVRGCRVVVDEGRSARGGHEVAGRLGGGRVRRREPHLYRWPFQRLKLPGSTALKALPGEAVAEGGNCNGPIADGHTRSQPRDDGLVSVDRREERRTRVLPQTSLPPWRRLSTRQLHEPCQQRTCLIDHGRGAHPNR